MAYHFRAQEPVTAGFTRIVREQIDGACKVLGDAGPDRDEAVHEARKHFKRIRALLRLLRSELDDVYPRENLLFRDTGRKLSQVRDATAIIETLDKLHQRCRDEGNDDAFILLREGLVVRRDRIANRETDLEQRIAGVLHELAAVRERVASWPRARNSFAALETGFEQNYRRARGAYREAYRDPQAVNFHEWRKRVKYLWYHSLLLRRVWPQDQRDFIPALELLAEQLGEYHDLTLLGQALGGNLSGATPERAMQQILEFANQRQAGLRAQAARNGERVFRMNPGELCARTRRYWNAWRSHA